MDEQPQLVILTDEQVLDMANKLQCVICLTDPVNARLCHLCSKIFCSQCIETAYNQFNASRCPHCR